MIFNVIDALIANGVTDEQKKRAVTLGTVGARLPHGQRDLTIQKLIALAPRQARASFLLSLVLSGEDIDIKLVADGIMETFEAAKKDTWILTEGNAHQLRDWLRLLPFATPVSKVPAVVRDMPEAQRNPHLLEEMVGGLGNSPLEGAEAVLFRLAEDDPRFYLDRQWRATVLQLGTVSAARRLVDLMVNGKLSGKPEDDWQWRRELGSLIIEYPDVRAHVRTLLKDGPTSQHLELLAHVVAENPGTEELIMLIDFEIKTGRSFVPWQSIRNAVTKHVPSESWKGAYDVVPVPAVELRQRLLEMTTGGVVDPAARALNIIDELRDDYGAPEAEPRHPDLKSGRPWGTASKRTCKVPDMS